ncbi:PKD domain-containing protein [Flavobacteriales bacterium]|nr:PKD domain-containing protein [Flavobacteriales bacterium]
MKKITLILVAMFTSFVMSAQGVYVIDVCGNITNAGAGEPVSVDFWGGGQSGVQSTTTDSAGNWCVVYTLIDSVGSGINIDYLAYQINCWAGDSVAAFVTSDTSFTSSWLNCNSGTNCSVTIADSLGIDLCAIPSGVAPFTYSWSDGSNGQCTSNLQPNTLYTVVVTDATGCASTATYQTTGNPGGCSVISYFFGDSLGLANFGATSNSGIAPFTYEWDFGDGNTANGQYVANLYIGSINVYNVCVTVTDAVGCQSTDCQTITLSGNSNQPTCDVLLSYYQDSLPNAIPATVTLDAYPTGVAPFTYDWYFSDGNTVTTTTSTTTYSFTQGSGWDWACVEVTDANGCVASYCDYIQITSVSNTNCSADFYATFDDVNGNPGEVFFVDYSYSNANIVSWSWDLGDGTTSTLQNPVNTYTVAGYYTVCLTTTDASGCTSSTCQTCYIDPAWWANSPWNTNSGNCVADFVAYQDSTLPGMIYLVNLSQGNNLYYTWDFGSGVIVNNQFPAVTFTTFGLYDVCLTVTDTTTGCSDTFCDSLLIDSLGNLNKLTNWGVSVIPTPMPQSITSVENVIEQNNPIAVYPNPTTGIINLDIATNQAEVIDVKVVDVTGKMVMVKQVLINQGLNTYTMSAGDLPTGIYFVKIQSNDVSTTKRVVIQH